MEDNVPDPSSEEEDVTDPSSEEEDVHNTNSEWGDNSSALACFTQGMLGRNLKKQQCKMSRGSCARSATMNASNK
ncbi:hypothetical protein DPEC_G00253810 [Dallia pectoralis]|uniref:Uncharacterized protein n=1 Tax=Dallia pectoralis TaxID=75939 RepID=A0ACC2FU66_DALPE|nr:hypothetical protein DPEC_G00253810 [Dallia pectoralis]